ncbi:MAG TPA: spermidine synthase [Candidatus Latescibacteria bacterium]|nr:spermidine synthase [Candidatus Latescibacterota bacterium]|tara:strand:- start:1645 stop:2922 length:1278 start_codon:yes stop_codon:yes gene_type:complete
MDALGRHILVEFFGCTPTLLNDVTHIECSMVKAATDAGLTIINTSFHHFSPYGISGVVVIQESHLSIHTWPEYGFAAVDLFTCGGDCDSRSAQDSLEASLAADRTESKEIARGRMSRLPSIQQRVSAISHTDLEKKSQSDQRNIWFTRREQDIALSLRHGGQIFSSQSEYQKVEILDTYGYGKMLVLDGSVTLTERDEFVYHEMIAHVPAQIHKEIRRALVIGGGDGGATRELLRYETIEQIDVVEIDRIVVEACSQHLPDLADALHDRRVTLRISDGIDFLQNLGSQPYDVVLVDAIEPAGETLPAFNSKFYQSVCQALTPRGLMVIHTIPPALDPVRFKELYDVVSSVFGKEEVFCYMALLPTYTTGTVSFLLASKDHLEPRAELDREAADAFSDAEHLQYYTGEIHKAAFALPPHLRRLLEI